MKEEEDAPKKAFDGTAFASFLFGPGGWQARAVLLPFGVPRDDGNGSRVAWIQWMSWSPQ
jgi:hypothetical protein